MPSKSGKHPPYKRIEQRAAEGDYSAMVVPLDYFILDELNDEGTMFAGLYPEAHTGEQINEKRFEGKVSNQVIGTRFLVLRRLGLVVKVRVPGRESAWQRTERGKKLLNEWKKGQADGQQ